MGAEEADAGSRLAPLMGTAAQQQFALLLWLPDYTRLFEEELEQNLQLSGGGLLNLPPSSYRQRLTGAAAV